MTAARKMQPRIEDYAYLSDTHSGALVSRTGSIDWLCFPRYDSPACFAALLGTEENGRWQIYPAAQVTRTERRYRPGTLVLETEFETYSGVVRVIDFMPPRGHNPDVVRIVEGVRGHVRLLMNLTIRFDYGHVVPWVRKGHGGLEAIGGPEALILHTRVSTHGENLATVADFTVKKGNRVPFVLTWYRSHEPAPRRVEPEKALRETESYWTKWSKHCRHEGEWREAVTSSLVVLKGLTYAPTGGIVAAPTTSLPEEIGGERNWDYRFCWLRDATLTLFALLGAGYLDEARAWREWLLRAVAGSPSQIQIMYGVRGERRLTELELPWLSGYHNSKPVRIGNGAAQQLQLDVFGEVISALYQAHRAGMETNETDWRVQVKLLDFLESKWQEPDEGIWEVRGGRKNFTHSKMMAWVAFDRAVRLGEETMLADSTEVRRFKKLRDQIHREVCRRGYNTKVKAFTQHYGSDEMDAAILMMPLVGFLPANDPRVRNTIAAVERQLMQDGLVLRYRTKARTDGLKGDEGTFLPCSFWLADCMYLCGRQSEARELFERLLSLRNDVGLLAEEYDPIGKRQLGNFPQAFTHVALVNTAQILSEQRGQTAKKNYELR